MFSGYDPENFHPVVFQYFVFPKNEEVSMENFMIHSLTDVFFLLRMNPKSSISAWHVTTEKLAEKQVTQKNKTTKKKTPKLSVYYLYTKLN